MIEASAPGKVVLAGEYAVLNGAPAICMAVNRRATATISAIDEDHHIVVAPGHVDEPRRFVFRNGVFGWLDSGNQFELLQYVWRRSGLDVQGGLALRLDTAEFLDDETHSKTGIGSSAALAVALSLALKEVGSGSDEALHIAHEGHLDFQGRLGSGVDIATSYAGGLVEYRMSNRSTRQLVMPAGLQCRLFWSGSPASTGKKLERYTKDGPKPSREALGYASKRIAAAWASGVARAVLDEYREYINVLQEFSADHDLGIFDAGHAELVALAEEAGLVYKPCGAGGGDIGILLTEDSGRADEFVAEVLPEGFKPLDLNIDEQGATVTSKDQ